MHIDLFLSHKPKEVCRIAQHVWSGSGREYEIGDRIRSGGNAVVHVCVDRIEGRSFAIKFQMAVSNERRKRFSQEIELLRGLEHDQLMSYVGHGKTNGTQMPGNRYISVPFVVMPLAERNLAEVIRDCSQPLLFDEYIAQFKGLAEGLGVLHQKAVHRDIKPENIMVRGETWLLSDFGLCTFLDQRSDITGDNEAIGPRFWMSPEAVNRAIGNDDTISKRSDVFQLGSVFWFVVTGRHPSGNVSEADWPGPRCIFSVLADALSHNAVNRPADGKELAQRLNDATITVGVKEV